MISVVSVNHTINKKNDTNEQVRTCIMDKAMESQTIFEARLSSVMENLATLNTKLDQHLIERKSAESKSDSLIIQKLNEIQSSNNSPSSIFMKRVAKDINKTACTSAAMDTLNWSFSFNQSLIPNANDNSDLFHLLNGFEKNTWASFDYLLHKLDQNTDTITSIESICKKIMNDNSQQHLQ